MSTGLDALGDIFILAQWVGYFMKVGPRVGFFTEIGPGGGDLCERWPQGREFGTKILTGGGEFGKKSEVAQLSDTQLSDIPLVRQSYCYCLG